MVTNLPPLGMAVMEQRSLGLTDLTVIGGGAVLVAASSFTSCHLAASLARSALVSLGLTSQPSAVTVKMVLEWIGGLILGLLQIRFKLRSF